MRILILGAGVQGKFYGVRLARADYDVTFIARGDRVRELRQHGAVIEDAVSGRTDAVKLPVIVRLSPDTSADFCLVTVRREQIDEVLADLARS